MGNEGQGQGTHTPVAPAPEDFGIGRLFARVRDVVVVADAATGRIVLWNPAAEALFGYSAEEARALSVDALVPERLREWLHAGIARYAATGGDPIVDGGHPIELPALTKAGEERTIELTLSPVEDAEIPGRYALAIIRDLAARKTVAQAQAARDEAESEQHRLALLAEASAVLASSLDYGATLAHVARLAVPALADGCSVDIIEEDGTIRRLAVACADPEREALARELAARYPIQRDAPAGVAHVLRTGRAEIHNGDEVREAHAAAARDAEHLALLRRLKTASRMLVPLVARGQTLGVLSFGCTDPNRRYGADDLALAEELARRAAVAIDNARLYESLARSEQRFRSLVQHASDIVAIFAADGTVRYISPPIERVLGYQPEQIVGTNPFNLIHPEDVSTVLEAFRVTVETPGYHRPIEMRLRGADGTWRVLEVSSNNLLEDPSVRGIVVNLHDVTARKRAEEEQRFLAEAGAVLANSLEYDTTLAGLLELTVPRLGDWCTIDTVAPDGAIQRLALTCADPAIERTLDELPRRFPIDPGGSHPIAVVLRTGEPVLTPDLTGMLEAIAENDEHRALLRTLRTRSRMTVPLVAHGQRLGAISFGFADSGRQHGPRDLALAEEFAHRAALAMDNARLYNEAQAALAGAQQALAVRDQFLSVASHELRTPLTALKGQIQLAERRLRRGDHARVSDLIRQADLQVERLASLIRDLLDVSRIAAGGFGVEREPVALRALVQRVVELERAAAPERVIALEMPERVPAVLADSERMEQVLVNLIENARKYSPIAEPIRVGVEVSPATVAVAVEDRGVGIPQEELRRIFERFHRASNVDHNIAGLGLGLYIAKQIVEAHGGELRVESTPGAGSTFTVVLPRDGGEAD